MSRESHKAHKSHNVTKKWLDKHADPTIQRTVKHNIAIATKIYTVANSKGISIENLAVLTGYDESSLRNWLTGQFTFKVDVIARFEVALGVDIITYNSSAKQADDIK